MIIVVLTKQSREKKNTCETITIVVAGAVAKRAPAFAANAAHPPVLELLVQLAAPGHVFGAPPGVPPGSMPGAPGMLSTESPASAK